MKEWGAKCPVIIVPTKYYSVPTDHFRKKGISLIIWANHNIRTSIKSMQETSLNPDLSYFNHIVPCGIKDKTVTSLQNEVGHPVDMNAVKDILKNKIAGLFEMNFIT